nr:hypothetical protein B0A51_16913 [Rachicladosporium sp. CCFEE 5018]
MAASRPIMTSLNGDNSWLLSFPRPPAEHKESGKAYYHIVFEPWLHGPSSTLSPWPIHLSLPGIPSVLTPSDLEALIQDIEVAAGGHKTTTGSNDQSAIDAILLGFHYNDHVHEPTLKLLDKRIPVIATPDAAAVVKPWCHFDTVTTFTNLARDFDPASWRSAPSGCLPSWLNLLRFPGHHELNYCLLLVWSHLEQGKERHEAILQSPHGLREIPDQLQSFFDAEPAVEKLALLHGLKESYAIGHQNTFGAKAGLALHRAAGDPKYWVTSHNSPLLYSGVLMHMLYVYDTPRTIDWAMEQEASALSSEQRVKGLIKPNVIDVENGGRLVLV